MNKFITNPIGSVKQDLKEYNTEWRVFAWIVSFVLILVLLTVSGNKSDRLNLENIPTGPSLLIQDARGDYCDNAPECYTVDATGEELQFGDYLTRDLSFELVGHYNGYQRKWATYAWKISHDKELMYMLKSENGLLNHDRQSEVPDPYGPNGYENSWGFCQIHKDYHPTVVKDPRFFTDPAWQMKQCLIKFRNGTTFYGYNRMFEDRVWAGKVKSHFKFST